MSLQTQRVFNFALTDFYRNRGMSLAAIFILTIVTLLVTVLFLMTGMSNYLVGQIQNKIDVTAYFIADAKEQDILGVKQEMVKTFPALKKVEYVSQDQALADFNEKHSDNPVFSKALTQVGDNPFLPSLNIVTDGNSADYEKIAELLNQPKYSTLIQKVDFSQKKDTIEKVFAITRSATGFGMALAALLILVALAVVFNTIKLVVDHSRDEIATMRMVGASSWYIRAPFIIEGGLFGLVAFVICVIVMTIMTFLLSSSISVMLPGFSLASFFLQNIFLILLIQLIASMGLGIASSYIVVKKYLNT